jgi:hypothetical protein
MSEEVRMDAANDSRKGLDDEPDVIFVRRYLLPVAIVGSLVAIVVVMWALSL